ncbi:MAG TPA: PAS domain S-box protein [Deltaproteobacteria bacterium]|nr:PAS domain S-box protein [Deltaproteobacteria bacterium]HPP81448.1 PAS domain S-box protein [Deltaproteobacteria bacterium]
MSGKDVREELRNRVHRLEDRLRRLKRLAEGLVDAAGRYRIHFSLANDVIYSIDRDFIVTSVSPSVERVLGYRPEELVGRPFYEHRVIPEEYVQKAFDEIRRVLGGEKIVSSVYTFITKDGRVKYGEVTGVPYQKGGRPVEVISVARDITERIEMERSLRMNEQLFRAVFESARDCIFLKDTSLRYTYVNPCMERALKVSSRDIVGRTDGDVFGPRAAALSEPMDKRVLAGEELEHECVWAPAGEEIVMHVVKVPIRDLSTQTITGLCGIARDVTERRRAEERLKSKEHELELQACRLEEMNVALRVLLDAREREKREAIERLAEGVRKRVVPYLERLRGGLNEGSRTYLDAAQANIEDLFGSNMGGLERLSFRLTPMELRVAELVRLGKSTKEIASALGVSTHAVSFHRGNIRKKCGIAREGGSLYLYLRSLDRGPECQDDPINRQAKL